MSDLRLYFSFRSPFSWLAHHRLAVTGAIPWRSLEPIPVYPPDPETAERVSGGKTRGTYLREDASRIAHAYGLQIVWPETGDPDWARPHSAFLWAQARGAGQGFASELYRARFQEGADIGTDERIGAAAEAAGLDPADGVSAAEDPRWREVLRAGFGKMREDRAFGVPTFVVDGERFWGNDRLEWVLRLLAEKRGAPVPDLAIDLLGPPCPA
jgi:2-hydroxychromene-2-carboxylate isomerase